MAVSLPSGDVTPAKSDLRSALTGELEAFQDVIGEGDQSQMLSRLVSRVATLETAVAEAEARRRDLHNQLVRLRGNVRAKAAELLALMCQRHERR